MKARDFKSKEEGLTIKDFGDKLISCGMFLTEFTEAANDGVLDEEEQENGVALIAIPLLLFLASKKEFDILVRKVNDALVARQSAIRSFGIKPEE